MKNVFDFVENASYIILLSYIALQQKLFKGKDQELSVVGRLAAGACAGMTSTLVIVEHLSYCENQLVTCYHIVLYIFVAAVRVS